MKMAAEAVRVRTAIRWRKRPRRCSCLVQHPLRGDLITGYGVCSAYGLRTWGHLFTDRQLVALTTFSDLVSEARERVKRDCMEVRHGVQVSGTSAAETPTYTGDDVALADGGTGAQAYADAVATYLGMGVSRMSDDRVIARLSIWESW